MSIVKLGHRVEDAAASQLLVELMRHGFCYVQHDVLPPDTLRAVKAAGRAAFAATTERQRQQLATTVGFRGFYQYVGASGKQDVISSFSIGRPSDHPVELRRAYFDALNWREDELMATHGRRNVWWPGCDTERRVLEGYYHAVSDVVVPCVLDHIAAGIAAEEPSLHAALFDGAGRSCFAAAHSRGDNNLEVKYYPRRVTGVATSAPSEPLVRTKRIVRGALAAVEEPAGASAHRTDVTKPPAERLAVHSDLSSVTLLIQDAMGGLEVLDARTDAFVPVPVLEDAVLVNAGTFLERWTGGVVEATPHRVRNAQDDAEARDRCSIVCFGFPDFDARIQPLPIGEETPLFIAGDLHPVP